MRHAIPMNGLFVAAATFTLKVSKFLAVSSNWAEFAALRLQVHKESFCKLKKCSTVIIGLYDTVGFGKILILRCHVIRYGISYQHKLNYPSPVEVPLRQEVARHPQEVHDDVKLVDGTVVADGGRYGCSFPG